MEKKYFSLTPSQYNIYSMEITASGTDIGTLYYLHIIEEKIDVTKMTKAINQFIKENDTARTRIILKDNEPFSYIADYEEINITFVDLSEKTEEKFECWFRTAGQHPFVFENSQLFDFQIVKLSENRYGLFTKCHHIWTDGWGLGLVWTSIFNNYTDTPNIAYNQQTAFMQQEPAYQKSEAFSEDQVFWKDYFSELSLEEAAADTGDKSDLAQFQVDSEQTEKIHLFCNENDVNPYAVFMAGIAIYRYCLTDCKDIVAGMPRLCRDTDEARDTMGMFVSEIPMRLRLNPNNSFLQVCKNLLEQANIVREHKKYPLANIIAEVKKSENIEQNIVDFAVSYQKAKIDTTLPIKDIRYGAVTTTVESFIVQIFNLMDNDEYTLAYFYKKSLFTKQGIKRFHKTLMNIILTGIAKTQKEIKEFQLVSEEEKEQINQFCDISEKTEPSKETIIDLFDKQVNKTPDKTAVTGEGESLTFTQLQSVSNAVAASILSKNTDTGIIAIILPRSIGNVIAALGVIKSGNGFLWVDPAYPQERIDYILENSNCKIVIINKELKALVQTDAEIMVLDDMVTRNQALQQALQQSPQQAPKNVTITAESPCYAIYTSGTTGRPKGTVIPHKGLVNLINPDSCSLIKATAEKGKAILAIGALSFDISILETFTTLLNGLTVVIATEEEIKEPELLAKKMKENGVNVLFCTPSRLLSYLEYPEFAVAMKSVDVVMSGGESFVPVLYEKLKKINKHIQIFNAYGPTEASIVTTVAEVTNSSVTIGKPVKGFILKVLSKQMQTLPIGAIGELYVSGVGVANGYLNLEAETTDKFIFLNGQRLYRTGDLVKLNEQGDIVYFGRSDNQIKLRGFRIELEEIETVFRSISGISSVSVIVKKSKDRDYLCGFYVADDDCDKDFILHELSKKLAYYMVPSVLFELDEIPINRNGKANKKELEKIPVEIATEYKAPITEEQKKLCKIFSKILELSKVGIRDNFFEIGGNSLLAARVAVEAKAQGLALSYDSIFKTPTIERLCMGQVGVEKREIDHFDYSIFDEILKIKEGFSKIPLPQNIFLAGATGYLGLHILIELIENSDSNIYCLVRAKGKLTPEKRLQNMLYYYFENSHSDLFGKRVFVVTGDITKTGIVENRFAQRLDLVLNCAADVSHYTYGEQLYNTNVLGVKNLIALCMEQKAKLVHISTPSIGQFGLKNQTDSIKTLTEDKFYFGQDLSNEYVATKFLAEREVLSGIASGLNAVIIRVGNLQARFSDGEFQINQNSNAFTGKLKVCAKTGFASTESAESSVDYSPIDYTAKAICTLLVLKTSQAVFHVFNDVKTPYSLIYSAMSANEMPIEIVESDIYKQNIKDIIEDESKREMLTDIISELSEVSEDAFEIDYTCKATAKLLHQQGFYWPIISEEYLAICVGKLKEMGAFE